MEDASFAMSVVIRRLTVHKGEDSVEDMADSMVMTDDVLAHPTQEAVPEKDQEACPALHHRAQIL